MTSSPQAGVVGATGLAGAELVEILNRHPHIDLSYLASRSFAGQPFADIYPRFKNLVDLTCEPLEFDPISRLDLLFLAVPHTVSMEIVSKIDLSKTLVVDLAADYRLPTVELFESAYGVKHSDPDNLQSAVYGLVEHNFNQIKPAKLVANPGCYATAVLLPLISLLKADLIAGPVFVDAKSGLTGAGRKPLEATSFINCNQEIKPYKVAVHRHQPEIVAHSSNPHLDLLFVPHIIPADRGIEAAIYFKLNPSKSAADLQKTLRSLANSSKIIRYRDKPVGIKAVAKTPFCDISVVEDSGSVVVFSCLDNLLKGAASQAVQNANLMLGFEDTAGLFNG